MKYAQISTGLFSGKPRLCTYDWPEDCFCQGGERGMVFTKGTLEKAFTDTEEGLKCLTGETEHYTTAFFEAFPKSPDIFIRGEGKNVDEAEESAWKQYKKFIACENHEFERRSYRNGGGFCKHCGMFHGKAFEPLEECCICGKKTYYTQDNKEKWYCEDHKDSMKEEDKPEWIKSHERMQDYIKERKINDEH